MPAITNEFTARRRRGEISERLIDGEPGILVHRTRGVRKVQQGISLQADQTSGELPDIPDRTVQPSS
jgi:hypothetical protein